MLPARCALIRAMSTVTVSACLIVRDEEANLGLCLEALAPYVDEICVVDTGSTDRTLEIARAHGARTDSLQWTGDFSRARNASLELATCDWVLVVDADELLDPESAVGLRALLEDDTAQAWLVWVDNLMELPEEGVAPEVRSVAIPRLFRRRPELRYSRPVHESIMDSLVALGAPDPELSGLRLVHSGYLPEVVRQRGKRERNLAILSDLHESAPEDLFNSYKLATTLLSMEEDSQALAILREAWEIAADLSSGRRARLPFLPLLASELVRLELGVGELSRAHDVAEEALVGWRHVSELVYQRAEVERRAGRYAAAHELYVEARLLRPWTDLYMGDPRSRGVGALIGIAKTAAMRGDLTLAKDALGEALDLEPSDLEVRALRARLLAVGGDESGAWSELAKLLEEAPGNPHVSLLAAELAWAKGEAQTAVGFWEGAAQSAPSRAPAEAWLSIAALVAGAREGVRPDLAPVDVPEAAARLVLAVLGLSSFELDPQMERGRLLEEVHAWLAELVREPGQAALRAFQAQAGAFEGVCPGIARLLAQG